MPADQKMRSGNSAPRDSEQGPWTAYRNSAQEEDSEQGPWTAYRNSVQESSPQPAASPAAVLPAGNGTRPVERRGLVQQLTGYTPSQLVKGGIQNIEQAGIGGAKTLGSQLYRLGGLIVENELSPFGYNLAPAQPEPKIFQPSNTAQKVGGGIVSAAEFLIPTGAEERAAGFFAEHAPAIIERGSALLGRVLPEIGARAAEAGAAHPAAVESGSRVLGTIAHDSIRGGSVGGLQGEQIGPEALKSGLESGVAGLGIAPRLGRLAAKIHPSAEVLGRIGASGLTTGAINALQGGSFTTGALTGMGTAGLGEIGKLAAPTIAETGLGIINRRTGKGFGRTPGKALLGEIGGWNLSKISENARQRVNQLTAELEQAAEKSNTPVSISPALNIIDRNIARARSENAKATVDKLQMLRRQLTHDMTTGKEFGTEVSAAKLLDLKRGVGDLVNNWPSREMKGVQPVIRMVYGAIDRQIDKAVPGADELNQRISSLIPVAERAAAKSEEPGLLARSFLRPKSPASALGAGMGLIEGMHRGGLEGALGYGALGLVAPAVATDPMMQIRLARILNSPATEDLVKGAILGAINASREETKKPIQGASQ